MPQGKLYISKHRKREIARERSEKGKQRKKNVRRSGSVRGKRGAIRIDIGIPRTIVRRMQETALKVATRKRAGAVIEVVRVTVLAIGTATVIGTKTKGEAKNERERKAETGRRKTTRKIGGAIKTKTRIRVARIKIEQRTNLDLVTEVEVKIKKVRKQKIRTRRKRILKAKVTNVGRSHGMLIRMYRLQRHSAWIFQDIAHGEFFK